MCTAVPGGGQHRSYRCSKGGVGYASRVSWWDRVRSEGKGMGDGLCGRADRGRAELLARPVGAVLREFAGCGLWRMVLVEAGALRGGLVVG